MHPYRRNRNNRNNRYDRNHRRTVLAAVVALLLVPLVAACGGEPRAGAGAGAATGADTGRASAGSTPAGPAERAPTGLHRNDGAAVHLGGGGEDGGDTPLYGTRWEVVSPGTGSRAHLTFDEGGTVSGSLGCNGVSADATVRDGHITVGTPATTRMVCEDSLMKAEKRLLRFFDTTLGYRADRRSMTLTSENGLSVELLAAV